MAREEDLLHARAFLGPCLLLLLEEGPAHGYELNARLKPLGGDSGAAGRVYRTLRRMEDEHLVRSRWDTSRSGPARKLYELTAAGRRAVETSAAGLQDLIHNLFGYLARHRELRSGSGAEHDQLFEVFVEATMLVRASDPESAPSRVEDAFDQRFGLDLDVWHKGPVWTYEATRARE